MNTNEAAPEAAPVVINTNYRDRRLSPGEGPSALWDADARTRLAGGCLMSWLAGFQAVSPTAGR